MSQAPALLQAIVVEDDDADAALVLAALARARHVRFAATRLGDLKALRDALDRQRADVLLLDLSLPDGKGLATVQEARRLGPRLPIIVLTGHDDPERALQALDAGAQDYLVKGAFDADALERAIRYAISRQALELRLRDAEERWRFALEGAGDAVWDRNFATGEVFFSRRWKEMLGYDDAEVSPSPQEWFMRVHPQDAERVATELRDYLQANAEGRQTSYVGERRMRHKDGHWVWVLARGMVVARDAAGQPMRMIGTHTDISRRKAVEEALRESERRYERLVQNIGDAIVVDDLAGRIVFANRRFEELLGQQALEGHALQDHVAPAYRAALSERRDQAMAAAGSAVSFEYEGLRQDGTRLWLQARITAVIDAGQLQGTQAAVRDITDQRRAEAALRAQHLAEQASRAKTEFVSRISHELRTPLNAILGFSDVLLVDTQRQLAPDQLRRVERIHRAGEHLLVLINDLLDITRIEAGALTLRRQEVDTAAVLREAVRDLAVLAEGRRVKVHVVEAGSVDMVQADAARLRQVVNNLLSNAIKYNRSGGRVELRLEALEEEEAPPTAPAAASPAGWVRLSVIDNGLGMTAEQQASLFQPFNRLGREDSAVEGTGIGLVIARHLVELMGGTLRVHSDPAWGSRFELLLQRAGRTGQAAEPPPSRRALPQRDDLRGHVLYIDDNESNRALMQAYFGLRPGLTLTLAPDAASGLQVMREIGADLLLIDMRLPDAHGLQVLEAVRALRPHDPPPCIAVSAQAMPEDIARAEAAGFCAYLTKPLSAAALLAAVDRQFS